MHRVHRAACRSSAASWRSSHEHHVVAARYLWSTRGTCPYNRRSHVWSIWLCTNLTIIQLDFEKCLATPLGSRWWQWSRPPKPRLWSEYWKVVEVFWKWSWRTPLSSWWLPVSWWWSRIQWVGYRTPGTSRVGAGNSWGMWRGCRWKYSSSGRRSQSLDTILGFILVLNQMTISRFCLTHWTAIVTDWQKTQLQTIAEQMLSLDSLASAQSADTRRSEFHLNTIGPKSITAYLHAIYQAYVCLFHAPLHHNMHLFISQGSPLVCYHVVLIRQGDQSWRSANESGRGIPSLLEKYRIWQLEHEDV